MRRPPDRVPRLLVAAGWVAAAGLVVLGPAAGSRRPAERLGPTSGHLADGLPPIRYAPLPPPAPAPVPTAAPLPAAAPASGARPAPPPGRRRLLAEVEAAFAARRDSATRSRKPLDRLLPRPLAGLRMAAEPLIMPRLRLPRALTSDLKALRGLTARARPGELLHVKLTAYCLKGTTRQGTRTRPGVIAADPHVFPLDRHVEIYAAGRHLGRFRVEDTGGAVHGPHLDIWTPDCDDAVRFGTRPGVASLVGLGRE